MKIVRMPSTITMPTVKVPNSAIAISPTTRRLFGEISTSPSLSSLRTRMGRLRHLLTINVILRKTKQDVNSGRPPPYDQAAGLLSERQRAHGAQAGRGWVPARRQGGQPMAFPQGHDRHLAR